MFSLAKATKSMDGPVLDFSPDYQALFAVALVARCALDLDDSQKVSTPPHAMSRVVTLCRRSFMTQGTVKFYNDQKGFGFIAPDNGGDDVFVHATALERCGMSALNEGQKVQFTTAVDPRKGKTAVDQIEMV
jgi:cold shock protein